MASRPLSALLPVLAFACLLGCKGNGGVSGAGGNTGTGGNASEDGAVTFSRAELLGAFGACAANLAHDFRAKAVALDAAVSAYAATADAASRDAARQAFKDALDSWQVIDPIQFGPTASGTVLGGQELRSNIYNYPGADRCLMEEEVILTRAYETKLPMLLPSRRGLGALEYLLFYEGTDTACVPTPAAWTALPADELNARKRAYAAAAARDVLARAMTLDEAWDPAKMNFVQTMKTAGAGSPVYTTQQLAIESVGLSMFFFDNVVKDRKLAVPLGGGVDARCMVAVPPLTCYESPYAGRSKANVRANLDGLHRITEGCDVGYTGLGFDDLLENVGAADAAGRMRATVAAAEAALNAIEEADFPETLAADRASLQALREAVGAITTFLKTEMYTLLGFEESVIPTDTDS